MKKENFALTILSILIFAFLVLTIILFTGCDQIMAELPKDFPVINTDTIEENPVDTISEPIVVDTCEAFEQITTPVYSSWFINMDVPLVDTVFYYNNQPVNISTFFDKIYYSGQNIGGFSLVNYGSNKVYVRDGGAKHYLQFTSQGLNFRGALTFDQYWDELQTHKSAQLLKFQNTGYSCEQILQVLNFFLEGCYETPDIIDLRPVSVGSCVFDPELIEACEERGSIVYQ
jgi:hypothetical protein